MDCVVVSSPMNTYSLSEVPIQSLAVDSTPPSMEANSDETYVLTDLSCNTANHQEQTVSNDWSLQHDLFADLDYERPSTSSDKNVDSSRNGETQEEDDPTFKYYYMLEDSHADVLKKLEDELLREEAEEKARTDEIEAKMKELEKGAEEFVLIHKLEEQMDKHAKRLKEMKAEKERIIQVRKELAKANREREIFCCFVCSKVFFDEEEMREHVTEKHLAFKKEYKLKCSKCYRRFSKRQHLFRHERTHQNISLTCRVCCRDFREEVSLKIHMSKVHSLSMEGVKIGKDHLCNCGQKFGIIEELKRHRYYCQSRGSIAEKRRKAREELDAMSSVTFESTSSQSVTMSSESSSTVTIGSSSGRPVKDKSCPICFLVFASMQSRRRHIERKHPAMLGSEEVEQVSYIKVQSPAFPYACELCSKAFASHASLSTHRKRVHENKKDHECTICSKRYPLASELKKHIKRVHENSLVS
ncbi:zinc finger, C2H2 type [Necator americanus]|uniref:Zinc finger, C2H2 type n=1 Tax=Necator americanus TaxID=51031 RepID=W2TWK7_NECAM|nr:zinc finger, C2H2 type [Necator americanus]ETN86059.1 zinc finger, C2H2 type [Necator americanus]